MSFESVLFSVVKWAVALRRFRIIFWVDVSLVWILGVVGPLIPENRAVRFDS